jgi:hypothetical protein
MTLAPVGGVVLGSGAVVLDDTPTSEAVDDRPRRPSSWAAASPVVRWKVWGLIRNACRSLEILKERKGENRW